LALLSNLSPQPPQTIVRLAIVGASRNWYGEGMRRWTAVYHVDRASPGIDALEVRPAQPDDPTASTQPYLPEGAWIAQWAVVTSPAARVEVYQGLGESLALTSRQLRSLQPARAIRSVMSALHDLRGAPSALTDLLGKGWLSVETRGSRSSPLLVLAATSARYVDRIDAGDRTPVASVARELGLRHQQIRDRLHRARFAELLTPPGGRGRAGGKWTQAAIDLLRTEGSE
jgi:hypothetical protein